MSHVTNFRGAKRTWPNDRAAYAYDPPSRHKPGGNPAMQQSPVIPGVLSFGAAAQARVQ